jgi:hypothetical protein
VNRPLGIQPQHGPRIVLGFLISWNRAARKEKYKEDYQLFHHRKIAFSTSINQSISISLLAEFVLTGERKMNVNKR